MLSSTFRRGPCCEGLAQYTEKLCEVKHQLPGTGTRLFLVTSSRRLPKFLTSSIRRLMTVWLRIIDVQAETVKYDH